MDGKSSGGDRIETAPIAVDPRLFMDAKSRCSASSGSAASDSSSSIDSTSDSTSLDYEE